MMVQVVQRTLNGLEPSPRALEHVLFDTLFEERRRLETEKNQDQAKKELVFYHRIQNQALTGGPEEWRELLSQIIRHFAEEVLGHFDPRIYQLATRVIPSALNLLLNTLSPLKLIRELPNGFGQVDKQIKIMGQTEALQKLAKMGTTILVPTHSSNLDSILIGYSLHRLGLPPYIYGAGLNLFSSKVMGFFMDHLGAYKVDRRKKAKLYKEVLKNYAGYSMELGYHNLFFPGGTRSRSGQVEQKLKLGLTGMGLNAYIHNLLAGKRHPDIFVIPATINYQLVLEAETLIEDHLKEVGKGRYIIEDDEFSKVKRILEFVDHIFTMESRIHVVISPAMDVFGNPVDEEGRSTDHRGRLIDRRRYILINGKPGFDSQRDHEYTRVLGEAIADAYQKDTVIGSVHLLSRTVFSWLKESNPGVDLYRLLRSGGTQASMPLPDTYRRFNRYLKVLQKRAQKGEVRLDETLQGRDTIAMVSDALAHLKEYHINPVMERRGDRLFHHDRNLILYYQNRLPNLEVEP